MFGRVSKLPVDVMFGNVERDFDVVDYDKYVKRLKDNLREDLTVTQSDVVQLSCTTKKHRAVTLSWVIEFC